MTITSSNPAVLSVSGTTVTAESKGTATLTIKAGDKTETVEYTVGAAREADKTNSTVEFAKTSVATGDTVEATVTLKDQYGVPVTDKESAITVTAADVKTAADATVTPVDAEKKPGVYKVTFTAKSKSDLGTATSKTGDVVVKVDAVEFAKVSLTVKAPAETVAEWKLTSNKEELDLKRAEGEAAPTATLALKGYDAEGLLSQTGNLTDTSKYVVKSSDETVATVSGATVTAVAKGEATITVYEKQGALEYKKAELKVTVVDSTPVIKSATFKAQKEITKTTDIKLSDLLTVEAEGSKGAVKVAYKTIVDKQGELVADKVAIYEANEDGAPTDIKLGEVKFTKPDAVESISFKKAATVAAKTVAAEAVDTVTVTPKAATTEEQSGDLHVAVLADDTSIANDKVAVKVEADKTLIAEAALKAVKAGTATVADYKTLTGLTVTDSEVAVLNVYLKDDTKTFYETENAEDKENTPAKQSIAEAVAGVKAATSLTPVKGDSFTANGTTLTKYTLPDLEIKTTTLAALISTKGTNPTSVLLIDDNGDLHVTNDGTKRVLYALKKNKSGQGAVATTWVKFEITPATTN